MTSESLELHSLVSISIEKLSWGASSKLYRKKGFTEFEQSKEFFFCSNNSSTPLVVNLNVLFFFKVLSFVKNVILYCIFPTEFVLLVNFFLLLKTNGSWDDDEMK